MLAIMAAQQKITEMNYQTDIGSNSGPSEQPPEITQKIGSLKMLSIVLLRHKSTEDEQNRKEVT